MSTIIYTGFWINRSYDVIRGATLTLSPWSGAILTSAVATFITVVTTQLWKIIMYVTYYSRVSNERKDGLFHQQQIVFRNSTTPGSVAWSAFSQAAAWRGKVRHALSRCLPWAVLSLVYIAAAAAAAVFSSQVSKGAGPARLLQPQDCGLWGLDQSANSTKSDVGFRQLTTRQNLLGSSYTRACYHTNDTSSTCQTFARPELQWSNNSNASCPFSDGICLWGETAAFSMETSTLNSHDHLGINAPPRNRIWFQKKTVCAPLHTTGYVQAVNGSEYARNSDLVNDTFYNYMYGSGTVNNYTFQYNKHARFDGYAYGVDSSGLAFAGESNTNASWVPIPALKRPDADVVLTFITPNNVWIDEPCDDPIFAAHKPITSGGSTVYRTDHYVGVIGCAEQYSVCNPNSRMCTHYGGSGQFFDAEQNDRVGFNEAQKITLKRLGIALEYSTIYLTTIQGGQSLRASDTLSSLSQLFLPPNQWQVETSSWFDAGLAKTQQAMVDFVTGPPSAIKGLIYYQAANSSWEDMCKNQVTYLTQGTISFSVLGLVLTFVLGVVILFISVTVDWILMMFAIWFDTGKQKRESWRLDDKMQLHRMLCLANGLGDWEDGSKAVPTTQNESTWFSWRQSEMALKVSRPVGGSDGDPEVDHADVPLTQSPKHVPLVVGQERFSY